MNVSRRKLLVGAAGVGAVGVAARTVFPSYESDVWVTSNRSSAADVTLAVTNLDADRTVLDHSFTLAADGHFKREGVFADDTRYRVAVQSGEESVEEEFETCCRGFSVGVYVEPGDLQMTMGHYD